ncbi:hypothetical protein V8D89_012817 [Ganoderma adspersum]
MRDIRPHPSASARVLTNPDLLHCIFMLVPLTSTNRDGYLARCAVVCRTFHKPTIRLFWIISRHSQVKSAKLYRDPIRWDRFLWHTAHIREIHHRGYSQTIDDENRSLIQALIKQNGGNAVLPFLRTIQWLGFDPWDGALTPFFVSTLRHATLAFNDGYDEASSLLFIRGLRESSPLLEQISLHIEAGPSVVGELACMPRLRHIGIARVSGFQGLQTLLTKPELIHLGVADVAGPWVDLDRPISAPNLRELLVAGDMPALSRLFKSVRFQALKRAAVHVTVPAEPPLDAADITPFLVLIYNAVSACGLESLEFMLLGPGLARSSPGTTGYPALRDLVAPVLPLAGLRVFSFFSRGPITTVDDADLAALARTWGPTLTSLSLDSAGCRGSAVRCPSLTELSLLGLRFPAIGVDEIPTPNAPRHPLRQLTVPSQYVRERGGRSGIEDAAAEALARYLLDR